MYRNPALSKRTISVALLLLALPSCAGAVDRVCYGIRADVSMDARLIRARASIVIPPAYLDSANSVTLDAVPVTDGQALLEIDRIEIAGAPGEQRWTTSESLIHVGLPEGIGVQSDVRLVVDYRVPLDEESLKTWGYYLYMGVDPESLWYPDVVGPGGVRPRFRDFEVSLTVPKGIAVVTTGLPGARRQLSSGLLDATFAAAHVEGFALALGDGFVTGEVETGGARATFFCMPDLVQTYRKVAELTVDAMAWYRKTYGFLPVERISVLPGHSEWGGGYPLPNMFMVHRGNMDPDFLRWITGHELGHYYWGLYVLGSTERLDWLQLANGIWADQLYMADRTGRTIEEQWRTIRNGDWYVDYFSAMLGNHQQSLDVPEDEADLLGFDYNSLVRHAKGAVGLYLQARRLGTERYLEFQRELLREYKYRPLPLNEFVERIEKAGAEGAREFFEKWRRGDASVNYAVAVDDFARLEAGFRYTLSLTQKGTTPYPVTIEVRDEQGHTIRLEGGGRDEVETIVVDLAAALAEVRIDPDGTVPMLNSSHPDIQKMILIALWGEDLGELFGAMASAHLRAHPDDVDVHALLVASLFGAGRYGDVVETVPLAEAGACSKPGTCRMAIYLVRALKRTGRSAEARELLDGIHDACWRLGANRRWEEARTELEGAQPKP